MERQGVSDPIDTLAELKDWLTRNNDHLKTYSIEELADLAIAAGFSRLVVAQWLTHMKYRRVI